MELRSTLVCPLAPLPATGLRPQLRGVAIQPSPHPRPFDKALQVECNTSFLSLGLHLQMWGNETGHTSSKAPLMGLSFWDSPSFLGPGRPPAEGGSRWRVSLSCDIWWCVLCVYWLHVLKFRIIHTELLLFVGNREWARGSPVWGSCHLKLTFNFSNHCWCLIT